MDAEIRRHRACYCILYDDRFFIWREKDGFVGDWLISFHLSKDHGISLM